MPVIYARTDFSDQVGLSILSRDKEKEVASLIAFYDW